MGVKVFEIRSLVEGVGPALREVIEGEIAKATASLIAEQKTLRVMLDAVRKRLDALLAQEVSDAAS